MKLLLAISPEPSLDFSRALPHGTSEKPRLLPKGFDRRAGLLALLGQEPKAVWTGPAPWGLASVRRTLAEDETGYLLSPVRVEDGVIVEEVRMGSGRLLELVEWMEEELLGDAVSFSPGEPPLLVVAEPHIGPSSLKSSSLVGRSLGDMAPGPPAVLKRVIEGSRLGCLEIGGRADVLFPHSPGAPSRVQPLRETWLGLGLGAVVGNAPEAYALAELLCLSHIPCARGLELEEAEEVVDTYDLVVAVLGGSPDPDLPESFPEVPALAVASWPDRRGVVDLRWWSREGQEVDEGVDMLKPLALGRGQSGRLKRLS